VVRLDAGDPLSAALRDAVGSTVGGFVSERAAELEALGGELAGLTSLAEAFTSGGKRLRPAFCCWGWSAATGSTELPDAVRRAAASLDLLHVSALVHDDVMDDSATRRGLPSAHVQLAADHAAAARRGESQAFGRAGAILLGDLLLMWSVELFNACGASPSELAAAQPLMSAMRSEVTAGQFLDITAQTRPALDARGDPASVLAQVRRVVEFKTARYTVVRPLQVGAALGGAGPELLAALEAYGSPLGRAFQFRDDVLGVFGDEATTGKPAGDDLREGKLTVLVAEAMAALDEPDALLLAELLGRPLTADEVAVARRLILESGALARTEAEIETAAAEALDALSTHGVDAPARTALAKLVRIATDRDA
jgi:geranylgeranyl diphosphate synthase type I